MTVDSQRAPLDAATHSRLALAGHSRGRAQYISDLVQGLCLMGDTGAILGALALSSFLTLPEPLISWTSALTALSTHAPRLTIETVTLLGLLSVRRVYDRHLQVAHHESAMSAMGKSVLIWGAILLCISTFFQSAASLTSGFVLQTTPIVFLSLISWRICLHTFISRPSISQYLRRRVLVLGWTKEASRVLEFLGEDPTHPYEIAGYLEMPGKRTPPIPKTLTPLGQFPLNPKECNLDHLLREHKINHLVLADSDLPPSRIANLSRLCENEFVELTVIPAYFPLFRSGLRISNINGVPLISVSRLPLDSVINRALKRSVDILGAIVGLILSAPLVLIFGALVYKESPGPIFYRQRRLGLKGRVFDMFKIRSMRMDAETPGIVGWSTQDDPRRLKVGATMRRFNIDEVPQFFNVLRGEMSLVGPRPERPELTVQFNEFIDDYNVRHGVKPGITGQAQVKGLRGDTELSDRIREDIDYIEHWSLWTDFKIMFLTFFNNKNAC